MAERIQSQVWRCLPDIPILERLEYWELEASLGCTVKSCIKRTQKKQRSQLLWCTCSFPCLLHTIPGLGLEVCSSESHWPAMFKRMVSAQRRHRSQSQCTLWWAAWRHRSTESPAFKMVFVYTWTKQILIILLCEQAQELVTWKMLAEPSKRDGSTPNCSGWGPSLVPWYITVTKGF